MATQQQYGAITPLQLAAGQVQAPNIGMGSTQGQPMPQNGAVQGAQQPQQQTSTGTPKPTTAPMATAIPPAYGQAQTTSPGTTSPGGFGAAGSWMMQPGSDVAYGVNPYSYETLRNAQPQQPGSGVGGAMPSASQADVQASIAAQLAGAGQYDPTTGQEINPATPGPNAVQNPLLGPSPYMTHLRNEGERIKALNQPGAVPTSADGYLNNDDGRSGFSGDPNNPRLPTLGPDTSGQGLGAMDDFSLSMLLDPTSPVTTGFQRGNTSAVSSAPTGSADGRGQGGGLPVGGLGPITPFGPDNNLIGSQINPQDASRSRAQIAAETLSLFDEQSAPELARQRREVGQSAAKFGRIGAGMTTNELTDLDLAHTNRRNQLQRALVNDAAGLEMQDLANSRNELRGERGYQYGLSRDSLADRILQSQMEEDFFNNDFNRNTSWLQAIMPYLFPDTAGAYSDAAGGTGGPIDMTWLYEMTRRNNDRTNQPLGTGVTYGGSNLG